MKPHLFDIHCHLNFPDFDKDRDEIIKRALDAGVWMINVGSDFENSKRAVEIAEKYKEGVYASVGLHPHDAEINFDIMKFRELANHQKVVAIGECGLDYFRSKDKVSSIKQAAIFKKQIELALEVNKPLMTHCRDAHNDLIKIFNTYYLIHNTKLRGNIHFFSGNLEQAQQYFNLGFSISFAGVITFTSQYDEIIKNTPLDKIMIETDAPFAAPVPYRGKRNEPLYVQEITKRMAVIRGISYEEIVRITTENALKFFNLI